MRKSLLFLLLSVFAFGQNFELLKSIQNGNEDNVSLLSNKMIPGYKLLDENKKGIYYTYSFVPTNLSENQLNDCKIGNSCEMEIIFRFKLINDNYIFSEAYGNHDILFSFWKNQIQPDALSDKNVYTFQKDEMRLWYNLQPISKSQWMIRNRSNEYR